MVDFRNVKVGDMLVCVNPAGWDGDFVKGGVYEVTEVRESEPMVRVGAVLVHEMHAKDFVMGEREGQPKSYQATDFTIEAGGKPLDGFSVCSEITAQERQEVKERLESPSGYVTKTVYQSVGDITKTVTYHFEEYEDFQRYEDSLNEENV